MASVKESGASADTGLTSSHTFTLTGALAAGDRVFVILGLADNNWAPTATLNGVSVPLVETPVAGVGALEFAGHGSHVFHLLVAAPVAAGASLVVDYSLVQGGGAALVTRASACYAVVDGIDDDYFLSGWDSVAYQQVTGVTTLTSPVVVSPADAIEISFVADSENDTDGTGGEYGTSAWTPSGGLTYVVGDYNTSSLNPQVSTAIGVDFAAPTVGGTRGDRLWTATNAQTSIKSAWTLVFSPVNERPIANAGPDQEIEPFAPFEINASASTDDSAIASYAWTQLSGIAVTLGGSGAIRTVTEAPAHENGTELVFQLVVTDDEGAVSNAETVTVTVLPCNEFWAHDGQWVPMRIGWL